MEGIGDRAGRGHAEGDRVSASRGHVDGVAEPLSGGRPADVVPVVWEGCFQIDAVGTIAVSRPIG